MSLPVDAGGGVHLDGDADELGLCGGGWGELGVVVDDLMLYRSGFVIINSRR